MQMVNIGTNMCISSDEVESIMDPKSVMVKRMVDSYRERNRVFDATRGKKTLSVIFTKRGNAYLTVFKVDTLKDRFNKACEPFRPEPPKHEEPRRDNAAPKSQVPNQGQRHDNRQGQKPQSNFKQNQNGNFRRN